MKKKTLQKISRLFASLVLVGAMSLGTVAPVNAAPLEPGKTWESTEDASAVITVNYKMGADVKTPESAFKFLFTKVETDNGIATTNMPNLANNGTATVSIASEKAGVSKENYKVVTAASDNFLTSFKEALKKSNEGTGTKLETGKYTYKLTQQALNNQMGNMSHITFIKTTDSAKLSQAEYTVYVYVGQDANKNLYIKGVGITNPKDDTGTDTGNESKVDGTPGTGTDGSDQDNTSATNSKLVFVNEYIAGAGNTGDKDNDNKKPDPDDPTTYALKVSNTETGSTSDVEFSYSLNIEKPKFSNATDDQYTYYKVDASKNVGPAVKGTYGTPKNITLKKGECVLVKYCYAGSKATVEETGLANWKPTAKITMNATVVDTVTGAVGANLKATGTIGQDENKIEYTNEFKDIAVTGIIVNNFPFVMMIVMAMAAFVAIVAVKSRRRMNER